MAIWFKEVPVDQADSMREGTMLETLDIRITEAGEDYLRGTMPVDHRTVQPYGILHGGASVVLAETLGSIAGNFCLPEDAGYCVGLDINSNHIRSVSEGKVIGIARPYHSASCK